ncbi:hypothetical protein CL653_01475 [bacterium]|nr:hypothetical protein [bacterium]
MEALFIGSSITLNLAISLGVGSSTLAILHFFKAIWDGEIDETERGMLGVVYVVLRVAMVLILIAYLAQVLLGYAGMESYYYESAHAYSAALLLSALYVNAILMTAKVVPSTVGPALQAASWYTLGLLASLVPLGILNFSFEVFLLGYMSLFAVFLVVVNGVMIWLRKERV